MNQTQKIDFSYLFALFLLNPLIYTFHKGINGIFPDSAGYIVMGSQLLTEGMLYIPGWGHVDEGLILPPLYPFLIGIGRLLLNDGLLVSQYVSQLCMILSIIPLFFYIKRLANREMAFIALLLIQLNYYYFYYGMVALTEASFILTTSIGLWLMQYHLTHSISQKRTLFSLGLVAALIFFSRQVGLVFILMIIGLLIIRMIFEKSYRTSTIKLTFLISGFMLLVVPYAITLYLQTGQFMFTQYFRLGHYIVTAPTEWQTKIAQAHHDYESIYAERRESRQLLPDASEIDSKVIITSEKTDFLAKVWEKFKQPQIWLSHLWENSQHFIKPVGIPLLIIFSLTLISALFSKPEQFLLRNLLPIFVISYLVVLSLFTSLIERYVEILFIYLFIHLLVEMSFIIQQMIPKMTQKKYWFMIIFMFSLTLWLTPQRFTTTPLVPKMAEAVSPFAPCANWAKRHEAIFSFHPLYSYLLGGTFRSLPNDSLDKVIFYAKKTSVRWLVLTQSPVEIAEREYYLYSPWLASTDLASDSFGKMKKRCNTQNEEVVLYEILSSEQ